MAQAITSGPSKGQGENYWHSVKDHYCGGCSSSACSQCHSRRRASNNFDSSDLSWKPSNASADEIILPDHDDLAAKSKDIIRNTGIGTSAMNAHDDNIIGAIFRYSPKPLFKLLGWTHEELHDFIYAAKCLWKIDTTGTNRFFDAGGKKTFTQILSQIYRTYMSHGDGVATMEYLDRSNSDFKTAVNVFNPLRIQTPDNLEDSNFVRGGIRVNRFNYALGYFVFTNNPYDRKDQNSYGDSFKYIKSRNEWGRPNIIHCYDQNEPHQTRGIPLFTAALKRLKMLDKWESTTLDAALAQASYAATIESEFPDASAIAGQGPLQNHSPSAQYFGEASQYLDKTNIQYDGVKVNRLYPGEKFKLQNPSQPIQSFDSFEWAMLRHVSSALGITPEELTSDYSNVNYNGARAGSIKAWMHYQKQRERVAKEAANIMVECWLEEQITNGRLKLPERIAKVKNTPTKRFQYFYENKEALSNAEFFGQGMQHLDPLKGVKAAEIEINLGLKTGEEYLNSTYGHDFDEVQEQLLYEEVIKASNLKKARERAAEMGCSQELEEIRDIYNQIDHSTDNDIDELIKDEE